MNWLKSVSPRADLFSSTLSCNKKEEKNHQTSQQGREPAPQIKALVRNLSAFFYNFIRSGQELG